MSAHIFATLVNFLIPPRKSERLVNALSCEELEELQEDPGLPYHDPRTAALVWEIKYYGNPKAAALAGEILSPRITELAAEEVGVPLLLPVPMHSSRLKLRGFNQTELLCKALVTQKAGVEYAPHALLRVRNTPHQQKLARHKRLTNVVNSMRASKSVKDRVCIVVDDVTTTGATLNEAARALKKAGARVVYTLALAYS